MEAVKKLSPAVFGLIIICFILPFVKLTCSGQTVMTLTGFQLVTGTEVEQADIFKQPDLFDQEEVPEQTPQKEKVEAQSMAQLTLIAAILCLIISFIKNKAASLFCLILSISGAVFLLFLKINMDNDVTSDGQGIVQLEFQFAYWFSLLLFIAGAVIQWMIFRETANEEEISDIQIDSE
jgi:hypothetical protein